MLELFSAFARGLGALGGGSREGQQISNPVIAAVAMGGAGQPRAPEANIRQLIDEGYRRNVVIYTCIDAIAQSAAEPRIVVRSKRTKQEFPDGDPVRTLLEHPHSDYSRFAFLEALHVQLQAAGAAYYHKGRNQGGATIQLQPLRADRIQPIPDKEGKILGYEYKPEGAPGQYLPASDVGRMVLPDPLNDYHGLSPLFVAAEFADIDAEAANFLRDFFMNGAVPLGLLKLKTAARPEERQRIREQWWESFGRGAGGGNSQSKLRKGLTKWLSIGVINADVDYQKVASSPDEFALDRVWSITESRICAAMKVPAVIVQVKIGLQNSTYSNYETAVKVFWQETLTPIYRRFSESLTRDVAMEFGDDYEVVFDLDHIQALQVGEDARIQRATALFNSGLITRNEGRARIDYDPLAVDVLLRHPTAGPVDAPAQAAQPGMPGQPGQPMLGPDGQPVIGPDGQPVMQPVLPFMPQQPALGDAGRGLFASKALLAAPAPAQAFAAPTRNPVAAIRALETLRAHGINPFNRSEVVLSDAVVNVKHSDGRLLVGVFRPLEGDGAEAMKALLAIADAEGVTVESEVEAMSAIPGFERQDDGLLMRPPRVASEEAMKGRLLADPRGY